MKKIIIIVLIIILVGLGFWGYKTFYRPQDNIKMPAPSETLGQANFISIEEGSFSPIKLESGKDSIISFQNNRNDSCILKFTGFDSPEIKSNEIFQQTFPAKGVFEFFCLDSPDTKGQIIIE